MRRKRRVSHRLRLWRTFHVLALAILSAALSHAEEDGIPPAMVPENGEVSPPPDLPPGIVPSPWADVQRELAAVRVPRGPEVDGRLTDEVWELAPDGGPLVQADPYQGAEPSERTSFRVLYDEDALYVGLWCYDSEPDRIVATEMARDGRISADDCAIVVLDTFLDRRNGYQFRVNPNGARGDSLISDNVNLNDDWDGIWQAAATIDAEGWKAEIAIPFKTLSFDPAADTWGFNVFRQIQRRSEKNRWVAAHHDLHTYNVAEAGNLTGLRGLKQGIGLDLVPYALGRYRYEHGTGDDDLSGDVGGDMRYRITPNLTALLSYNTDFAETEVDARQINLTRFPLFFPEKRDFFLEDAGIFQFGGLESALIPFYSRRIGLSDEGEKIPILVAGKVTGRANGFNIGVVDALMDDQDDIGRRNAFVGRVSRNIFEQSSVGGLVTYGDPNSENENVLGGVDFRYRTTKLFGDQIFQANVFGLGTYTENAENDDSLSFGAELTMPNDLYYAKAEFFQVGEDFNPALGFAPRRAVRSYQGSLAYKPRPESVDFVRQLYFMYYNSLYTNLSDELETASHNFYPLFVVFESADEIFFRVSGELDAPEEEFEISPGVVIPPDDYWWASYRVGLETASKRPVELEFSYAFGDFYTGTRDGYSVEVDLKPFKHLTFRLGYYLNQIRLPQGDFETRLGSVRMKLSFTPDMIWYHLVQYDNVSDTIGYNSRFVWELQPGASIYFVLNQNIDRADSRLTWLESELTAKVGVTFRF